MCLWVRGSLELGAALDRSVAIVGARAATEYGREVTDAIAEGCVDRGFAVVSGAALGIDEVRYDGPVFVGTTVRGEIEVLDLRPTPGGSAWFGEVQDRLLSAEDRPLLRMRRSYLLDPLGPAA